MKYLTLNSKLALIVIAVLSCFLPGIIKGCGKDHVLMEVQGER